MPYQKGDRVIGPIDLEATQWKAGTITEVYRGAPSAVNPGVQLYALQWDGQDHEERGYMDIGLKPEPLSVGGLSRR